MNAPLISVIVPIYNVEKYVRKCLDSLLNQTMKQIEVIAIDDGSTDGSGRIADEYMNEDGWPIFRVIHTENRGLSAARNRGIDESVSDWIMFVDSDDWVSEDFCRMPYEAALENQADMVKFGSYSVKNEKVLWRERTEWPIGQVDEMIAHEYGSTVVWNKLYMKVLFEGIRYPEGRICEDTATTHKLVHKAHKVFFIKKHLYYHASRKGSITQILTAKNKRDGLIANIERKTDLVSYGYPEEKMNLCGAAISFLSVTAPCDDPIYEKAEEIVAGTEGIPDGLTMKQKAGLVVWRINKSLFYLMCKGSGRI